jgi:hypothetical protein
MKGNESFFPFISFHEFAFPFGERSLVLSAAFRNRDIAPGRGLGYGLNRRSTSHHALSNHSPSF